MLDIQFTPIAFEQYNTWLVHNKDLYKRLQKLILECTRTPFEGTGKPEALKHDLKGYWSRRIDDEHRLVYRISDTYIKIVSCKNHY